MKENDSMPQISLFDYYQKKKRRKKMTGKEAYERLDWALHKLADALGVNFPELAEDYDFNDTLEKMQELSIRDTPMKPLIDKLDLWAEHKCPVCESTVWEVHVHKDENFCSNCGQRLDWSEENE